MKRSTTIQLRETLSEANLRALHQQRQLSVREIAAQLDVATKTIYSALDQHNIAIENYPIDHHKPHLKDLLTKQTLSAAITDEKLTVAQIAARYDCSVQTIYTYLRTHRIDLPEQPPRTHKPDELTIENVRQLYHEQQLSIRDTAKRIGVSNKALRNFMDRHNMERRNYVQQLDTNKIVDAYQSGATLQDLADQYDCSLWAITKRLDDAGIARRIGKRPAA